MQGYFPTKRKQHRRGSSIEQMVNVMKENSYLWQRRHEEKSTDMFFLSMAKMTKKLPSLEQAKIKLQLSQAVLQALIALEEKQESSRLTSSAATSCSSFNSTYAIPRCNVGMIREYMGPEGNTPQDLLDISRNYMAINSSHEMS
jgi:hypothetical protein